MAKKLSTEEFIAKARELHGDKYDYSKVEYRTSSKKVCIICPKHGEFWQTPNRHLSGSGCKLCNHRSFSYTQEEFIEKAKQVHDNKYDYSKVEYINSKSKVCIICPKHGEFWQTPEKHFKGQGCPKCRKNKKMVQEEFIEKAKQVHDNKYDYSKVEYVNNSTKVCIICPKHGEFWQTPHCHLSGKGCIFCKNEMNVNETKVFDRLKNHFKTEIIRGMKLPFLHGKHVDMFMPSYNVAIEYQGIQHFRPIKYFGGFERFVDNIKRDEKKFLECKENGVKLFYISFEKHIPTSYFDTIYRTTSELIKNIEKYAINK